MPSAASPHQEPVRGLAPDTVVLVALLEATAGGFTLRELIRKFSLSDENEKMQLWENLMEMERRMKLLVPRRVRSEWSLIKDKSDWAVQETRYIYVPPPYVPGVSDADDLPDPGQLPDL